MSFRGWTPPEVVSGHTTTCYQISVPDNDEHRRAFFGALHELTKAYNWDTEGDESKADEIATYWRHLLFYELAEGCESGEPEDEAPYWEDIATAAGEGRGTRWDYEDIADWAITAFLAVAGSPGAALFYKTTVPKARLAFQSHDLGAIADVFIDGILAFSVNTVSTVPGVEEIIEADIDLIQFAADNSLSGIERTIRIVKAA